MHCHGPSCLKGPVTGRREWWNCFIEMKDVCGTDAADPGDTPPSRSEPEIRWDLVHRVRQEIDDGTYETPDKWEAALDRLLKRLEAK